MEVKSTKPGLIHHKSRQEYLGKRNLKGKLNNTPQKTEIKSLNGKEPTNVELTKSAQNSSDKNSVKEIASSVGKNAASMGLSNLKPAVEMAKSIAKSTSGSGSKVKRISKAQMNKPRKLNKEPVVFFFNGFELFADNNGQGLRKLAEHIPGARLFKWQEEDKAMEEIAKHHPSVPLVLAGHSLGGDTAVSIAKKLNNLDNGYRKVDLLITLDSFGLDNDVIPANVDKNLNFIGEKQSWLNDGPNIARDVNETIVLNELRSEAHTDIDGEDTIHKKIFESITPLLNPLSATDQTEA